MTDNNAWRAFAEVSYAANDAGIKLFLELVLARLPPRDGLRVLDIGCGTGDLALAIAQARPQAEVVGVDISQANVETARRAAVTRRLDSRATFVAGSYGDRDLGAFDVIVTDSVLQLISMPDEALARQIRQDLRPGGLLLATLPDEGFGNYLRIGLRRLWRRTGAGADRMLLAVAKVVYPAIPVDVLRDRLPYLRFIPVRLYGPKFERIMASVGMERQAVIPWPATSIAKPRHRCVTWHRRPEEQGAA